MVDKSSTIPLSSASFSAAHLPVSIMNSTWNLRHQVVEQLAYIRDWSSRFVVPIPAGTIV